MCCKMHLDTTWIFLNTVVCVKVVTSGLLTYSQLAGNLSLLFVPFLHWLLRKSFRDFRDQNVLSRGLNFILPCLEFKTSGRLH